MHKQNRIAAIVLTMRKFLIEEKNEKSYYIFYKPVVLLV